MLPLHIMPLAGSLMLETTGHNILRMTRFRSLQMAPEKQLRSRDCLARPCALLSSTNVGPPGIINSADLAQG
jgi:hypothetical protein